MIGRTGRGDGVLPEGWALPALSATNRAWFTSGQLALQRCAACAVVQHPPEEVCHACGSSSFTTRVVAPAGTVHSYTVAHHAVHTALEPFVPYAVVLVSLDEVPEVRVVGNLLGVPVGEVAIGLAVEAVWVDHVAEDGEVIRLPQWRAALEAPPAG
jgi:uncharacterized OB-fold protein